MPEIKLFGKPINLSDIHRKTGISVSHLSRIFSRERNPSVPVSYKIADYFTIDIATLLNEITKHDRM